ncbi:MAG TPA: SpoIIE family protein phosphatase [Gemmata sp.]|nr:SpoIIE family protein phosphatase [Gemmata sp.]
MPTLQLLTGPQAGMHWPVLGNRFVIGRARSSDVEINDPQEGTSQQNVSVSRKHALITFADDQWYIEDGDGDGKKSRNGTYVNDKKLPYPGRRVLRDQDRIRICDFRFIFRLDQESTFSVEASVGHLDSSTCLDTQPADRLRLLLDISAALRGTLDADAVLDRALEHLFKMFPQAERGLVVFREDPAGPLVVRVLRTPHGKPADPRFSSSVVRRCLESMEAILGNDLPIQFPESDSIGTLPSRSLICTPLWTPGGQALGAIQLDTRMDDRKFTPDDLRLLLGVASQASISLSNARLHHETLILQRRTRDLEVAQQVQRALLPRTLPEVPEYGFYTHYESAQEVGGDYYDFVPLPDGRLAVLLGDVAGKGVAAALVVAKFSVEARVCLENNADPAAAVDRLNALMIRAAVPEKFVTLAVAVLDPVTHTVVVVNAGHPSPILLRASGEVEDVASDDISGFPIGIAEEIPYMSREVRLKPGDRLLVFSDGVSEALDVNEKLFGTQGIRTAVRGTCGSPLATGEHLLQAVKRHTVGCDQNDDITVVCFGRSAG